MKLLSNPEFLQALFIVLVCIAAAFAGVPWFKHRRRLAARRKQLELHEEEKQRSEMRINFAEKKIGIVLRESDNSVSELESLLIEEFIVSGADTPNLPVVVGHKLAKREDVELTKFELDFLIVGIVMDMADVRDTVTFGTHDYHCDIRIFSGDSREVLGAKEILGWSFQRVAFEIAQYVSGVIKRSQKVEVAA